MNLNPGHLPTYKALFPVLRTQTGAEGRIDGLPSGTLLISKQRPLVCAP